MCVVCRGYGRLSEEGKEVVDCMHAGQSQGSWSHVRRCQGTLRVRDDTLITPPSRCADLGRSELELVGHPGKALTWDATRMLRFVVHAAG